LRYFVAGRVPVRDRLKPVLREDARSHPLIPAAAPAGEAEQRLRVGLPLQEPGSTGGGEGVDVADIHCAKCILSHADVRTTLLHCFRTSQDIRILHGIQPQKLSERQEDVVAEFADFCRQFYPELLPPLGLTTLEE